MYSVLKLICCAVTIALVFSNAIYFSLLYSKTKFSLVVVIIVSSLLPSLYSVFINFETSLDDQISLYIYTVSSFTSGWTLVYTFKMQIKALFFYGFLSEKLHNKTKRVYWVCIAALSTHHCALITFEQLLGKHVVLPGTVQKVQASMVGLCVVSFVLYLWTPILLRTRVVGQNRPEEPIFMTMYQFFHRNFLYVLGFFFVSLAVYMFVWLARDTAGIGNARETQDSVEFMRSLIILLKTGMNLLINMRYFANIFVKYGTMVTLHSMISPTSSEDELSLLQEKESLDTLPEPLTPVYSGVEMMRSSA